MSSNHATSPSLLGTHDGAHARAGQDTDSSRGDSWEQEEQESLASDFTIESGSSAACAALAPAPIEGAGAPSQGLESPSNGCFAGAAEQEPHQVVRGSDSESGLDFELDDSSDKVAAQKLQGLIRGRQARRSVEFAAMARLFSALPPAVNQFDSTGKLRVKIRFGDLPEQGDLGGLFLQVGVISSGGKEWAIEASDLLERVTLDLRTKFCTYRSPFVGHAVVGTRTRRPALLLMSTQELLSKLDAPTQEVRARVYFHSFFRQSPAFLPTVQVNRVQPPTPPAPSASAVWMPTDDRCQPIHRHCYERRPRLTNSRQSMTSLCHQAHASRYSTAER